MAFWSRRREQLAEEMAEHLQMEIDENLAAGMSAEQARAEAHKKFGNLPLAMDSSRQIWGLLWLEYLWLDLRYAARLLRRSPGYVLTVVLTLGLGLGASATIFTVVDSVLLRPLPFPHPQQLVSITGFSSNSDTRIAQYKTLTQNDPGLKGIATYQNSFTAVGSPEGNISALTVLTVPQFFSVLDAPPLLGRLPAPGQEAYPGVVVSYNFWRNNLHADPKVIGATLKVQKRLCPIVAVLARSFRYPFNTPTSAIYTVSPFDVHTGNNFYGGVGFVIARLKPGVTLPQAEAHARALVERLPHKDSQKEPLLQFVSLRHTVAGGLEKPLLITLAGVMLILLIALSNMATLILVRNMKRREEMQIRAALGAAFSRLLQPLLAESLIVSLLAAGVGILVAFFATDALRQAYGVYYARFSTLSMAAVVYLAILAIAIFAGVIAAVAPALRLRRMATKAKVSPHTTMRMGLARLLVVGQIALTCILLVVTALFLRTLRSLEATKTGFNPHHLTLLVVIPLNQTASGFTEMQTDEELLARFRALPGVSAATTQDDAPLSEFQMIASADTGFRAPNPRDLGQISYSLVGSQYLAANGDSLIKGRGFLPQDTSGTPMVVLVNQAFVQKFIHGENPLGMRLQCDMDNKKVKGPFEGRDFTIVGVVGNQLTGGDPNNTPSENIAPTIYVKVQQIPAKSFFMMFYSFATTFEIRSSLPPATLARELRSALHQTAPDLVERQLEPMEQAIAESALREPRLALHLVGSFGLIALLLSALGLYGILAYLVTLRRREIGIRLALGSSRAGVVSLVLRQASSMVALAMVPGLVAAWFAGRAIRSYLHGVQPLDPVSFVGVAIVLTAVALLAAALPAASAARVEPMEVLRAE